eukprot:s916_g16.t1
MPSLCFTCRRRPGALAGPGPGYGVWRGCWALPVGTAGYVTISKGPSTDPVPGCGVLCELPCNYLTRSKVTSGRRVACTLTFGLELFDTLSSEALLALLNDDLTSLLSWPVGFMGRTCSRRGCNKQLSTARMQQGLLTCAVHGRKLAPGNLTLRGPERRVCCKPKCSQRLSDARLQVGIRPCLAHGGPIPGRYCHRPDVIRRCSVFAQFAQDSQHLAEPNLHIAPWGPLSTEMPAEEQFINVLVLRRTGLRTADIGWIQDWRPDQLLQHLCHRALTSGWCDLPRICSCKWQGNPPGTCSCAPCAELMAMTFFGRMWWPSTCARSAWRTPIRETGRCFAASALGPCVDSILFWVAIPMRHWSHG